MKRILLLIPLTLGACTSYRAADPSRPPLETAYAAIHECNISDPVYQNTAAGGMFGLVGYAAYGAAGGDARTRACMAAKGFAAH